MSRAATARQDYDLDENALCSRRGCPEPATIVPRICFHGIVQGKNSEHRTDPLTTFAHCADCARGIVKVDALLGPGELTRLCDQIESRGQVRPLGGLVEWVPL